MADGERFVIGLLTATVVTVSPLVVKVKPGSTQEPAKALTYTPVSGDVGHDVLVLRRADTSAVYVLGKV